MNPGAFRYSYCEEYERTCDQRYDNGISADRLSLCHCLIL